MKDGWGQRSDERVCVKNCIGENLAKTRRGDAREVVRGYWKATKMFRAPDYFLKSAHAALAVCSVL